MKQSGDKLYDHFFSQEWIEEALHYYGNIHNLAQFYCSQLQKILTSACMVVVQLEVNGIFSKALTIESYPQGSNFPVNSEEILQLTHFAYSQNSYKDLKANDNNTPDFVLSSRLHKRLSLLPLYLEARCFAAILIVDAHEPEDSTPFFQVLARLESILNPLLKYCLELNSVKAELADQSRLSRSSQERLLKLSDLVPVGIFRANPSGAFTYVNKTWCQLAQLSVLEAHGLGWLSCIHPEDLRRVKELWFEALRAKSVFSIEYRYLNRDGNAVWILSEAIPELDLDGDVIEYIGTAIDISNRKDHENYIQGLNEKLEARVAERSAQLQKMQQELIIKEKIASLNPMVAAISHELNTPLGIIITLSGAMNNRLSMFKKKMEEQLSKRDLEEFINYIDESFKFLTTSTEIATTLVRSFKNISVDRAGAERKSFDLVKLIKELVFVLGPDLRDQSYRINYELPEELMMDSYPGPLNQILDNLVRNVFLHAFNCSDEGTVTIKATIDATLNKMVRIDLCDDGCGIGPENISKIFDPFYTTKLGQGGSGLGLSIVYNLVNDVLGGSISVESWTPDDHEDRHGTQFTLRIPQNRGAQL